MTVIFENSHRLETWVDSTLFLLENGPQLNVVLSILSPESEGLGAKEARTMVDEFLGCEKQYPLHTVAETIFPGWAYSKRGWRGVELYADEEYGRIKNFKSGWGTYAYRMLRRTNSKGDIVNPLKILITKMRDELSKKGDGGFRACYEIGIAEGEYDLPLYNSTHDMNRRRGGPCLSHVSFKLSEKQVHLTAIYRSHDYGYKTLGNLLGLARLQTCVANEIGASVGTLVVHSTYATVSGSKTNLRNLLAEIEGVTST